MIRLKNRIVIAGTLVVPAITALLLMLNSPFASGGPKLVRGGSSAAEGWRDTTVGEPITYGGMVPCVDKGSVTVTKIAFTRSSNLVVTGWGSRPNPFEHGGHQLGGEKITATAAGFQTGPRQLVDLCGVMTSTGNPARNDYECAVEFHRVAPATGWSYGLTVTYHSGGRTHTAHWPLSYVMCGNTAPSYPSENMSTLCH